MRIIGLIGLYSLGSDCFTCSFTAHALFQTSNCKTFCSSSVYTELCSVIVSNQILSDLMHALFVSSWFPYDCLPPGLKSSLRMSFMSSTQTSPSSILEPLNGPQVECGGLACYAQLMQTNKTDTPEPPQRGLMPQTPLPQVLQICFARVPDWAKFCWEPDCISFSTLYSLLSELHLFPR